MPALPSHRTTSRSSCLDAYFHDIDETPLLTAAEEKELAHRIGAGDPEARDHLVRANLRLVVNIARGYTNKGLPLADLIAEGNLGLVRAVEGYDPAMNTRFSTYAVFWIRQSVKRALVNMGRTIRIPAYMHQLMVEWRRASNELTEELGRPPTQEEVGQRLNLGPKKRKIICDALNIYNGSPHTGHEDEQWSVDDTILNPRAQTPDSELIQADNLSRVLQLVDSLGAREATVLRLRFGLDGESPRTLMEVGDRLGLTRERIRQIEREALARLREQMLAE